MTTNVRVWQVYKGKYRGEWVAVKILKVNNLADRTFFEEFKNEVNIMQGIASEYACLISQHKILIHPFSYVVKCKGACMKPPVFCIIMEFLEEGNLASLLKTKGATLTWRTKLTMMLETAKGLLFLHNRKISKCNLYYFFILIGGRYYTATWNPETFFSTKGTTAKSQISLFQWISRMLVKKR